MYNILIVSRGIPTDEAPKLGIFEFDQAKALKKYGHNVSYFSVDLRSIRHKRKWGLSVERIEGITVYKYNIPIGPLPVELRAVIGRFIVSRILYPLLKEKPDLIHAHFTKMGAMCIRLSRKNNIPLIVTEHLSLMNKEKIRFRVLEFSKYVYRNSDKLIAVSSHLAKNIQDKTGIEAEIVPNVVDEDIFSKVERLPHEKYVFVYAGDMISGKRPELLIEAFKELSQEYDDIELIMLGDGILKNGIQQFVDKNGLTEKVALYGHVSRQNMADVYSRCDCFVLASDNETFGVVYIEAMAAGLPVIATKCGGPDGIVNNDVGLLIERNNLNALVNAMRRMYNTHEQYDPSLIQAYAHERFSSNAVSARLTQIYSNLIGHKKSYLC